jgi:ribonuclease BN (tRNA processing enzyme)
MKHPRSIPALLLLSFYSLSVLAGDLANCDAAGKLTLQVLGSGGPIADDGRASTSYLVWIDGRSSFLIDTGGGSFLRFGEAGANFEDLQHIAISHLHTDHSTDLVALLKSGYFSNRDRSLSVSGPAQGGPYPGIKDYLARQLDTDHGAYAYLSGYLDGSDGMVELTATEVDPKLRPESLVYSDSEGDITIHALGVPHGPVPTLAYRIRIGEKSIIFAADQNGSSEAFINFANEADILVMHLPVPEEIQGAGRNLHAPPSIIGNIAARTKTKKLVLSHFMARSLKNLEQNLKQVQSRYSGTLTIAGDLDCIGF